MDEKRDRFGLKVREKDHGDITDKQTEALRSLSKAFNECKKAGLVFVGMDNTIRAFKKSWHAQATKEYSICEQQYIENGFQGYSVDDHGSYLDSGGW